MNYIKHLNAIFKKIERDKRLKPAHISLYMALFNLWNKQLFKTWLQLDRESLVAHSKIYSKSSYYRGLQELQDYGYLIYKPSRNIKKGSWVQMFKIKPLPEQEFREKEVSGGIKSEPALTENTARCGSKNNQVLSEKASTTGSKISQASPNKEPLINNINKNKHKNKLSLKRPENEKFVIDFFISKNRAADEGRMFFNYYQANGWKLGGRAQIMDWKAAAQSWMLKAEALKKTNTKEEDRSWDHLQVNTNKRYDEPL